MKIELTATEYETIPKLTEKQSHADVAFPFARTNTLCWVDVRTVCLYFGK